MATVKLTKNEFKKQKDALKMFTRYLPTLLLKKQQLQQEIRRLEKEEEELSARQRVVEDSLSSWIRLFGEQEALPESFVVLEKIRADAGNIAGVNIPVFRGVSFRKADYDLFSSPLWLDRAAETLEEILEFKARRAILKKQISLIEHELRITTQRVNLFEKVKIPETKNNIKKISIYLGDQQTAAVVRGKISKKNLLRGS